MGSYRAAPAVDEEAKIELEAEAIRNAARLKEEAEAAGRGSGASQEKAAQDAENARLAAEREEPAKERVAMESERKKAVEAAAVEKAKQDEEYAAKRQRMAVERAAIQGAQDKIDAANRAAEEERQRLAEPVELKHGRLDTMTAAEVPFDNLPAAVQEIISRSKQTPFIQEEAANRDPNPNCEICGGSGENRDAVQAWDIPGAPIPDCPCTKQTFLQEDADKLLAVASIVRGISVPAMSNNESMAAATNVGRT